MEGHLQRTAGCWEAGWRTYRTWLRSGAPNSMAARLRQERLL